MNRTIVGWVVVLACAAAGCNPRVELRLEPVSKDVLARHTTTVPPRDTDLPCVVRVSIPDRLIGREDTLLEHARMGKHYRYQAREVYQQAFQAAADRMFERADPAVWESFTLEVTLPQSLLTAGSSSARYRAGCRVVLRTPADKEIYSYDLSAATVSAFDGATVPQAVWDAAYTMANEYLAKASRQRYPDPPPPGVTVECDIKLLTMKGVHKGNAGRKVPSNGYRKIAEKLADDLVASLAAGQTVKVGVLPLGNNGALAKQNDLGSAFSGMLETALARHKGRITLIERARLSALLDEHDLKIAQLIDAPEKTLQQTQPKIAGVDLLLTGQISVIKLR